MEAQGTGPLLNSQKEAFLGRNFKLVPKVSELEAASTVGEDVEWKGSVLTSETSIRACSLPLATEPQEVRASCTGVEAHGNAM